MIIDNKQCHLFIYTSVYLHFVRLEKEFLNSDLGDRNSTYSKLRSNKKTLLLCV